MLGVSLAAIEILSTLEVGLAIVGNSPIRDNTSSLTEILHLVEGIKKLNGALYATGNTTADISSAALVALAF